MQHAYDMLYQGVAYDDDTDNFNRQRELLANLILLADSDIRLAVTDYVETSEYFEYKIAVDEKAVLSSAQIIGTATALNGG